MTQNNVPPHIVAMHGNKKKITIIAYLISITKEKIFTNI